MEVDFKKLKYTLILEIIKALSSISVDLKLENDIGLEIVTYFYYFFIIYIRGCWPGVPALPGDARSLGLTQRLNTVHAGFKQATVMAPHRWAN